ncbi:MAG: class I SAM-dependent methyltransferase [Myxococcaceae bacterium]|jgi:SAM-dependent methyltransferase|nr:class I SAM-dependent methyltransferase [Myxococcaceae bacterium]
MADPREFWNQRYTMPGFANGTDPNDFLREVTPRLRGPVLCLGEGEGRNAVYVASFGLEVTAVDLSPIGLEKAARLAQERGVRLTTRVADLADFDLGQERWGAIVSIWCHLPAWVRAKVHGAVAHALVPGGHFVLEAYTPRQLAFDTGGPKNLDLLYEPAALRRELTGLTLERCDELEREVREGDWHRGKSAVVQVLGQR